MFVLTACVHALNLSSYVWLDTASQPRPLVSILKKKHPTTGEGAPVATKHQKIQPVTEESPVERAPAEQSMYSVLYVLSLDMEMCIFEFCIVCAFWLKTNFYMYDPNCG